MYRVEDKYILTPERMLETEKKLQCIMDYDSAGGSNGYFISSVYFDDIKDSLYQDSLDGYSDRDKYRIRIYNNSFDTIKLEVKRKKYNRAYKISSLMEGDIIEEKAKLDDARTLFNLAIKMKGLRPRVIVAYDRRAYVCEAGNVRVTFDENLRASRDFLNWGSNDIVWDYAERPGSVLEVKYDSYMPKYIMQALEGKEMIQTANSKYVICREIYRKE